jgi:hypothetical protein
MPVPQDLQKYTQEIQEYLKLQLKELQEEYIRKNGNLPQTDPFIQLTQAINCVESLKSVQRTILQYWENL